MKAVEEKYEIRLLEFAYHLDELKVDFKPVFIESFVEWIGVYARSFTIVCYNPIFYNILPDIFEEWEFGKDEEWSEPIYNFMDSIDNMGVMRGCMVFFNLEPEELVHLFDQGGFQNVQEYGGKQLSEASTPKDIAYNIREFVKRRSRPANPRF
jgi:hypothetical protein